MVVCNRIFTPEFFLCLCILPETFESNRARTPQVIWICIDNFTARKPNNVTMTIKDGADRVKTHDTLRSPRDKHFSNSLE